MGYVQGGVVFIYGAVSGVAPGIALRVITGPDRTEPGLIVMGEVPGHVGL